MQSSKYTGVSKKVNAKKFLAVCTIDKVRHHIGSFNIDREAAIAVDKFRIKKGLKPINILKPKS